MTKYTFIGDVHGKFGAYSTILKNSTSPTIQVGDMGVGFFWRDQEDYLHSSGNPPYDKMVAGGHRFIRGNHDNPSVCSRHSQWIEDGHVEGDIMFVGGALSIDRGMRTLNEDYWADEELSIQRLMELTTKFVTLKPRIMVTHECPETVAKHLFRTMKLDDPSRTRQAFDSMFEQHKPEYWIFGHWHMHRKETVLGTKFICLEELQAMELDL